jgi:hypothetical protein
MAKSQTKQVPVSAHALKQRINRALKADDLRLVQLRGRAMEELGEFVIVPTPRPADVAGHGRMGPRSRIERDNVNLEKYGREIGVLRSWEKLVEEEG